MNFLNNKTWKFILSFLATIIAIFLIFKFIGTPKDIGLNDEDEQIRFFQELEEKYKNDTYGGDTPEETLQLFIDALNAGDTGLASKYFVIEKQEEKMEELGLGKESGGVSLLLEIFKKKRIGSELFPGAYQFNTYDKNEIAEFSFDLILNPFTNKWKIESL